MASQPIISFSEPVYHQPKPKVSFAVIAGQGAQAADAAVKALPAEAQSATLDDLAWRGMTEHLIATAEKLLSPRMYAAFLRWGEAASHLSSHYDDDKDGNARCDANGDAVHSLAETVSANVHDLLLKAYLSSLEAADLGAFSSLYRVGPNGNYLIDCLARGSAEDISSFSPLPAQIDDLAAKAWKASRPADLAIDARIGAQITAAFSFARGINSAGSEPAVTTDLPDAGDPSAGNELMARWEKDHTDYLSAHQRRASYECEVFKPAAPTIDDPIQLRYDDLVRAESEALFRLLTSVAPGSSELAIKLELIREHDAYELSGFSRVAQQLAFDSRRFAQGGALFRSAATVQLGDHRAVSEHSVWLRKRNEMVAFVNALPADLSESDEDALFKELHQLEKQIEGTPPRDLSGLFTQLLFAVQIVAEGHELNEETAQALVRTSIAISGEGYFWADSANAAEQVA